MLGHQPSRAEESPHIPKANPSRPTTRNPKGVAAATTEMMWSVALAATRASPASTARGLELWSRMLRPPGRQLPLVGPRASIPSVTDAGASPACAHGAAPKDPPATDAAADAGVAPAVATSDDAAAFARYRSSG